MTTTLALSDDDLDLIRSLTPAEWAGLSPRRRAAVKGYLARVAAAERRDDLDEWRSWQTALFPRHVPAEPAQHHVAFWEWLWDIEAGVRPSPFVGIWPRGGAKSTLAEMAGIALAARGRRRYGLYVCETQSQADDHVSNIANMLESKAVEVHYPALARRLVGKYGASKGWRRNRLRTDSGFTVDAIGLDAAARGAKVDEDRPDFIVIDDVDAESDSPSSTAKKVSVLTTKIIPAGSDDLAVLAIQNLVIEGGVFDQLARREAEYLRDAIVSGPIPALEGFAYEADGERWKITAGEPTWAGMGVAVCEQKLNDMGPRAFKRECQHEVAEVDGGMFGDVVFAHCRREDVPSLERVEVWCDPAVTNTDDSDSHAVQVDGLSRDGRLFRLWSWEHRASPNEAITLAYRKAEEYGAAFVGIETDNGRDTWDSVVREVQRDTGLLIPYRQKVAGSERTPRDQAGKVGRAAHMLYWYERPPADAKIVHVEGTHHVLEAALRRFPKRKPFDLVDAATHSCRSLMPRKTVMRSNMAAISAARL